MLVLNVYVWSWSTLVSVDDLFSVTARWRYDSYFLIKTSFTYIFTNIYKFTSFDWQSTSLTLAADICLICCHMKGNTGRSQYKLSIISCLLMWLRCLLMWLRCVLTYFSHHKNVTCYMCIFHKSLEYFRKMSDDWLISHFTNQSIVWSSDYWGIRQRDKKKSFTLLPLCLAQPPDQFRTKLRLDPVLTNGQLNS